MTSTPSPPSRLDPEPVPRRDLLGLAALASMAAALGLSLLGMLRLPRAAVIPAPSKRFTVALPESLAAGEAFLPPGRNVAIFRDGEGTYALSRVCTHLGCIVRATPSGFSCPCHGSEFARDGSVVRGPAPKALPWLAVRKEGGGYVIDEEKSVDPGTRA
jgi:cytochrome b6-f complex iron-sulfur subunit